MDNLQCEKRYLILLQCLLYGCSHHLIQQFVKQIEIVKQLSDVAANVKTISHLKRKEELLRALEEINFRESFPSPLNPHMEFRGFCIEKCKCVDAKRMPLWLAFNSADVEAQLRPTLLIFKSQTSLQQFAFMMRIFSFIDQVTIESD